VRSARLGLERSGGTAMTELPQATTRRELRERERAAEAAAVEEAARQRPVDVPRQHAIPSPTPTPRPRATNRHSVASRLLSVAAMIFAGALAVGTSLPANAFSSASSTRSASSASSASAATSGGSKALEPVSTADDTATASGQSVTVAADQSVDIGTRDSFQVQSWAEVLAEKYAQINNYTFSKGRGAIRWPFPKQATISSPFGPRIAPCAGCSTIHNGVDFSAAAGTPIFAIADGVVTGREDGTSEYGNYVIITHRISKTAVSSTYAHMLTGSSALGLGQTVHVGDLVGLVGMTGEATGPHLHLGITVNGTPTDPIPWLEAHVK
jgi:murein DD-endopeptidase MepM/ murein hydrolase activator NlpD